MNPEGYQPLTLHEHLRQSGRMRFPPCLEMAIALAEALEYLHANDLVHRDIKPANIVFVRGRPKLADIGLVAQADARVSIVGTEGFLPPEGPGKAQADIYSLGKVFYEMATGKDRRKYPEPPADLEDPRERKVFLEFNEVLLRCCEANAANRYQSAADLLTDLHLVRQGRSVRRLRLVERKLAAVRKVAIVAAVAVAVLGVALWQVQQARQGEQESNRKLAESYAELNRTTRNLQERNAERAMEDGDYGEAIARSLAAWQQAGDDKAFAERQRVRIGALLRHTPHNAGTVPVPDAESDIEWFELSQNGEFLLVTSASGISELWAVDPLEKRARFAHRDTPKIRLSPDSRRCCTFGDTRALVWDLENLEADPVELQPTLRGGESLRDPLFLQGGEVLVIGAVRGPGSLQAWNPATGEELGRIEGVGHFTQLFAHPTRPWLLHVFGNNKVWGRARLIRLDENGEFEVQAGEQLFLKQTGGWHPFSPEGNLLLTRESGKYSELGRVAIYRLSSEGEPELLRRIETLPNNRGFLRGGGFLAGETHIWLDFQRGVVVIDIESDEKRYWFADPPNNGVANPEVSRDGRLVALVGDTDTAFLDASKRRLTRPTIPFGTRSPATVRRHHRARISLGPSRKEGRLAAVASPSGKRIQLINLAALNPRPVATFPHPDEVAALSFGQDGRILATACADQVGRIWDIDLGRQIGSDLVQEGSGVSIRRYRLTQGDPHFAPQVDMEFGPQGRRLLFLDGGSSASLWSDRGEVVAGPFVHQNGIHELRFSRDGSRFLVSGGDGSLRVCETGNPGRPGVVLTNPERPYMPEGGEDFRFGRAAFHPSRPEVAVAGRWKEAIVWNWEQPERPRLTLREPAGRYIHRAEYTADGSRLVTLAFDHQGRPEDAVDMAFQVWDATTGEPTGSSFGGKEGPLFTEFLLSPSSHRTRLYAFQDFNEHYIEAAKLVCWDLDDFGGGDQDERWQKSFDGGVHAALSPDGTCLAVATRDGIRLLDAATGIPITPTVAVPGRVLGVALAADNRTVAVGGTDGRATVWRFEAELPETQLSALAKYHSWKAVGPSGAMEELGDEELRKLERSVAPLPDAGPREIDEVVGADRAALRKAVSAGVKDRADALFQRVLDGLQAQAENAVHDGRSERATELRRSIRLGRLLGTAQETMEFEPGDPLPSLTISAGSTQGEPLRSTAADLEALLPPAYGMPWREHWEAALASGPEGAHGASSQAAAFRERVQALLAGKDPAVLALQTALEARAGSFDAKSVRERKDLLRRQESRLAELSREEEAAEARARLFALPPRDPSLDSRLIDLTPHFPAGASSLYDGRGWHEPGMDLRMLPETFDHARHGPFDIRGIVQLNSGIMQSGGPRILGRDLAARCGVNLPDVTGIAVGRKARSIHFLHGVCFGFEGDREVAVAKYVVHFEDGGEPHVISVKHARDVVDWRNLDPLQDESVLAWTAHDGGTRIGVCKMIWDNPDPGRVISHLDFISAKVQSAPFLLAVTVE